MNLPELIGQRLVNLINANGDERIDHDEFVGFLLKMLMGSLDQKMLIAFKCYDLSQNDHISKQDIKLILNNIPLTIKNRLSDSMYSLYKDKAPLERAEYRKCKSKDLLQIESFVDLLFEQHQNECMYFDEFKQLAKTEASDLFVAIYDSIY